MLVANKITALVFLALGAFICFGAEKIAEAMFKEKKNESRVLAVKACSFIPVFIGAAVLFL